MPNNITMSYGDYNFSPVPFITLNKEYNKSNDGTIIGSTFNLTLDGTLTPLPTGTGGYYYVDAFQDSLRAAFDHDGKQFIVKCDSNEILNTRPRILNLSFTPTQNNWVFTTDYTINLEFDDEPLGTGENQSVMPPYIREASEDWNVEFVDDSDFSTFDNLPYVLRLTHNVSAVGKRHFIGPNLTGTLDRPAWEYAREYVTPLLGYDVQRAIGTGILNLDADLLGNYNHVRNQTVDELGGQFSVTETWLVLHTGVLHSGAQATESFVVTTQDSLDTAFTDIRVEGSIQGLETRDYGTVSGDFVINETKYHAASGYWNVVKTRLLNRAQVIGSGQADRIVNPLPVSTSVGHNPGKGIITYAYQYNDRPCNFIPNSRFESITITDTNPSDAIAELFVLGRANGPILQDLGTVTAGRRDVSIEAIVIPPTGCVPNSPSMKHIITQSPSGDVNILLCDIETTLTNAYSQVFKQNDQGTWNPKTGRYFRNVSWIYNNCDGVAPATSFC